MNWSWFEEFDKFFDEIGDLGAFLAQCFQNLPYIFTFVLAFIVVIVVISSGLYMLFKVIG